MPINDVMIRFMCSKNTLCHALDSRNWQVNTGLVTFTSRFTEWNRSRVGKATTSPSPQTTSGSWNYQGNKMNGMYSKCICIWYLWTTAKLQWQLIMHQPIPAALMPPRANPRALAFFSLGWQIPRGGVLKLPNAPR